VRSAEIVVTGYEVWLSEPRLTRLSAQGWSFGHPANIDAWSYCLGTGKAARWLALPLHARTERDRVHVSAASARIQTLE
jgi:hypothetical protein